MKNSRNLGVVEDPENTKINDGPDVSYALQHCAGPVLKNTLVSCNTEKPSEISSYPNALESSCRSTHTESDSYSREDEHLEQPRTLLHT